MENTFSKGTRESSSYPVPRDYAEDAEPEASWSKQSWPVERKLGVSKMGEDEDESGDSRRQTNAYAR